MELTAICRYNTSIFDNTPILDDEIKLNCKGSVFPDVYCEPIGELDIESGDFTSYFKTDKENNTLEKFKFFIETEQYVEKRMRVFRDCKLQEIIRYYVPYDIQESTRYVPTYTEEYISNAYTMNGYYHATYEVVFSCGEGTTRMTFTNDSVNLYMFDWLDEIKRYAEDIFEMEDEDDIEEDNPFIGVLQKDLDFDDGCSFKMFDYVGDYIDYAVESVDELLSMIVSIRQLGCEFIEDKKDEV